MDLNLILFRIRNWADLNEFDPLILPVPPSEALRHIEEAVKRLSLWKTEASDPIRHTVHLTRTTRVFRFTDDIRLTVEAAEGGSRVRGRSQSRVGLSDLGQNRRNLSELIRVLSEPA
jgi:uncharacterized protein (DUF1499 family)